MRVLAKEADVEAEGCSEGEKGESCPPAMGVHSLVSGQGHARGNQWCLALFPASRFSFTAWS